MSAHYFESVIELVPIRKAEAGMPVFRYGEIRILGKDLPLFPIQEITDPVHRACKMPVVNYEGLELMVGEYDYQYIKDNDLVGKKVEFTCVGMQAVLKRIGDQTWDDIQVQLSMLAESNVEVTLIPTIISRLKKMYNPPTPKI